MPASAPALLVHASQMRSLRCSSLPWHRPPMPRLGELIPGHTPLVAAGLRRPLAEPLDLAARVDDPLGAGEERMAHGADLGLELLASRASRERVPARAGDDRVFVIGGMDLCFQRDASRRINSLAGDGAEQAGGLHEGEAEVEDQCQPRPTESPASPSWNRLVVRVSVVAEAL